MLASRYELHRLLGRGGMAEVFEATAHGGQGFVRRVAIKRLLPGGIDETAIRMFFDEATIASRLHHAGIVAVLDFAVVDDAPFQVLELVDGWDAAALGRQARERGAPMPLEVALHVAAETAHALAYAHEACDERGQSLGIVHRDVKPSNILVARSADVKLGDFGIALARERASRTTGLVARGTPNYMSPEQLLGNAPVDARADLFALGCTIHALVTGWSPLSQEAARSAVMAGGRIPLAANLPPGVLAVVERAVSVDPAARFSNAREMAAALGNELAKLLRTDAKTTMVQWLQLAAPGERGEPVPPTVLVQAPQGTTTLFGGLTTPDRVFTSQTTSARTSPTAPVIAAGHAPHPVSRTMEATAPVAGPTLSVPAGVSAMHPSMAPRPPTATAPLAPAYAHVAPPAPPSRRGLVIALVLVGALALALVGAVGIILGQRLHMPVATDAGVTAAATPDAAVASTSAPEAGVGAVPAGIASVSRQPSTTKPGTAPPASADAGARSDPATPGGVPGTGAPIPNGCGCDANEGGIGGLCHPGALTPVKCDCKSDNLTLCPTSFRVAGQSGTCSPGAFKVAASAKDGDACQGFKLLVEKNASGKFETFAEKATPGVLTTCDRCAGTNRLYPRTPGAACVGIVPATGQRAPGHIACR